jgi:hypothetical protein
LSRLQLLGNALGLLLVQGEPFEWQAEQVGGVYAPEIGDFKQTVGEVF